jgi:stage V sporulation protein B
MQGGPEYACAAVALGITTAELASCMYSLTLYRYEVEKSDSRILEAFSQKRILNRLLHISLPVSASSLTRSSLRMLENIMIPIGFVKYGYTKKSALEEYGRILGMVIPVLMFPATVILAFSALLIPEVSEANALNQKKRVEYSVTRSLQLTCIMSILISGLFVFFSDKLGPAIYGSAECGSLMRVLAPLIPLIYLDIVVDELLKGLNQQVSALKYNIIDAVIKIILITYALPTEGLAGLIFVLYVCGLINIILSVRKLLLVTRLSFKFIDWICKPILSVAASGFMTLFLLDLAGSRIIGDIAGILIGSLSVCVLYFIFLVMLGCLTKDDFRWFRNIFRYTATKGDLS